MLETQIQIQASSCYLIVVCGYCFTSCFSCILRNSKKKKEREGGGESLEAMRMIKQSIFSFFLKLFYL